jgi:co-chaperonin GroES (HSP10)
MNSFPINLIGELLVVKPDPITGPIKLPDWKRSLSGIVVSTGPKVNSIKSGDRVSFGAAVGMDSVYSGQEVRILKEQDIDFVYEA